MNLIIDWFRCLEKPLCALVSWQPSSCQRSQEEYLRRCCSWNDRSFSCLIPNSSSNPACCCLAICSPLRNCDRVCIGWSCSWCRRKLNHSVLPFFDFVHPGTLHRPTACLLHLRFSAYLSPHTRPDLWGQYCVRLSTCTFLSIPGFRLQGHGSGACTSSLSPS